MQQITTETRKKVVRQHIQDGRTLTSLAAEYGVSKATISNWVRAYREECQTNDEAMNQAELEKENQFLKKAAAFFAKEID